MSCSGMQWCLTSTLLCRGRCLRQAAALTTDRTGSGRDLRLLLLLVLNLLLLVVAVSVLPAAMLVQVPEHKGKLNSRQTPQLLEQTLATTIEGFAFSCMDSKGTRDLLHASTAE